MCGFAAESIALASLDAGRHNYHRIRHFYIMLNCTARYLSIHTADFAENSNEVTIQRLNTSQMMRLPKIMNFTPTPGSVMEQAKDLFVFQLWTGLAYQDTQSFDFFQNTRKSAASGD